MPRRPDGGTRRAGRRAPSGLVITVLALCGTVAALQQTVVIAVLPDLPRLLDTSVDDASWVITTTLLAGAVATPTVSRLADMYGKRRMVMVCLALMVAGSVIGGLAASLPQVLVARALQGVGTALIPVGIAAMRDELPRDRVPVGIALMSATLAIGAGAGLPLSGFLVEYLDWHLLFWVPAVLGALVLLAVPLVLSPSTVRSTRRFDLRGAVLLSGVLTALLLALSKGGHWGWTSAATLGCAATGLALLAVWLPLQLRTAAPLVDLRVAARPRVLMVNVASVFVGFAMFANMLVTTQLLQLPESTGVGLGLTTLQAGLVMAPTAVVFGVMAPLAATVIRRTGPGIALLAGCLWMAAAYAARTWLYAEVWQVLVGSLLVSVGTSLAYAAMPTLILRSVPVSETASANGLNTLLRSVGTSLASAVTAAVVAAGAVVVGGVAVPDGDALLGVFWIAAAASLAAAVAALAVVRLRADDVDEDDDSDEAAAAPAIRPVPLPAALPR
ncbi:MFS transporter [Blastococcus sp. URHD0036]|uniref:MFS transporter n=1 Tax=Blastococcus sp. URHD0036 TaxID=1380356 RepID=UPI00069175B4|nr:MFS transporter [Blastococcus sp. URHD0036]